MMTESVAAIRLLLNLRYKLTYVQICETYIESDHGTEVAELLRAVLHAQQTAIAPLSSYLRRLGVNMQGLDPKEKLLNHAMIHTDVGSRLRFIHRRLKQAVLWYGTQLSDRKMTADVELIQLLVDLGEIDSAMLWRTESVMAMLKIPTTTRERSWDIDKPAQPEANDWRPRLVEEPGLSPWAEKQPSRWSPPAKRGRRKR